MMNAEILGFSVIDSGPVGAVHLPYHPGLTVLYGQNGAGKSYVLRGVTSALSGIRPEAGRAFAHVRVDDDYYWDPELEGEPDGTHRRSVGSDVGVALTDAVRSALTDRLLLDRDRIDEVMDEVLSPMRFSVAATALVHLKVGGEVETLVTSPEPIARAFGACRAVSLEAVGEKEPSWRMFLSGCADENAIDLANAMSQLATVGPLLSVYEDLDDPALAVIEAVMGEVGPPVAVEAKGFVERFATEIDRFAESDRYVVRLLLLTLMDAGSERISEMAESVTEIEAADNLRNATGFSALTHGVQEMGSQVLLDAEMAKVGALATALDVDRPALKLYAAFGPQIAPGWTATPLVEFGLSTTDVGLPRVVGDADSDTAAALKEKIQNHPSVAAQIANYQQRIDSFVEDSDRPRTGFRRLGYAEEAPFVIEEAVSELVEPIVREANLLLESLLPEAPFLQAAETDLLETFKGTWLRWEAFDRPSLRWVPVSQLSDAQRRWVNVALDYGDAADTPNGAFLVIDEPERALHRGAIGQLAARMPEFGGRRGIATLVATHAPEFINSPEAEVYHVTRTADPFGRARTIPMESAVRTEIASATEALGLTPADLLQLTRSFILVEGEHDKVVIEALLDDVLREQHARVIAIRGVDSLTTLLDSEILIPYTSARLVIVFDHISDPEALGAAWDVARKVAQRDPTAAVKEFGGAVAKLQRAAKATKEDAAAVNLAFGLLRAGYAARVDLFGFTKPGIEKYLPIRQFSDDPEVTWEQLDSEYMALPLGKRKSEKDWLRREHDINVTIDTVRSAVGAMDGGDISDEFTDLAEMIRRSGRPAVD